MKILHVRPFADRGNGRFRDVADFDVEINDGLRLHGLRLSIAPDGNKFVFSPARNGVRFASFKSNYAREMADAAYNAMGGRDADDVAIH